MRQDIFSLIFWCSNGHLSFFSIAQHMTPLAMLGNSSTSIFWVGTTFHLLPPRSLAAKRQPCDPHHPDTPMTGFSLRGKEAKKQGPQWVFPGGGGDCNWSDSWSSVSWAKRVCRADLEPGASSSRGGWIRLVLRSAFSKCSWLQSGSQALPGILWVTLVSF